MTRVHAEWRRDALDAVLYDWHNEHRLRRQQQDVAYWIAEMKPHEAVAVLGAGTGRVAVPLSRTSGRIVSAIDCSHARLRRIDPTASLQPICADMRRLPLSPHSLDAAIVPYSTMQLLATEADRSATLQSASKALRPSGHLGIDVSHSFDSRASCDWKRVLEAPCPELVNGIVEEWERTSRTATGLKVTRSFVIGNDEILRINESWVYAEGLNLPALLHKCGFRLIRVDHGYGGSDTAHRTIYHAKRRTCLT